MAIEKITAEKNERIKRKSAYALPARPSEEGLSPDRIKKAFYVFVTDEDDSVIAEINRIVGELNRELVAQEKCNGEVTAELAKKLNSVKGGKSGAVTAVYVNDNAGNDTYIPATVGEEEVAGESIIKRSADGIACVSDPYSPNHIANKNYVDKGLGVKLDKVTSIAENDRAYGVDLNGKQVMIDISSANTYNAIVCRDSTGRAEVSIPTSDSHIANKAYVDNKFVDPTSSGELTHDGDATITGDVMMRSQSVQGNSVIQHSSIVRCALTILGINDIGEPPDITLDVVGSAEISRDLTVKGNLAVLGTTVTENQETLSVKDAYIIANSDGTDIEATMSGVVIRTASDGEAYAILYDPVSVSVRLGRGYYDQVNRQFIFDNGEGKPIAIRSESNEMVNGNFPVWDSETNSFKDSGKSKDSFLNIDKSTSTYDRVYGKRGNGEQSMMNATYENAADSIMKRDISGHAMVSEPTYPLHIANKGYVDYAISIDESALNAMLEEVYA